MLITTPILSEDEYLGLINIQKIFTTPFSLVKAASETVVLSDYKRQFDKHKTPVVVENENKQTRIILPNNNTRGNATLNASEFR